MRGYVLKVITDDGYTKYWSGHGWAASRDGAVIYPSRKGPQGEVTHMPQKYIPKNAMQFKAESVDYAFTRANNKREKEKEIVQAIDLFRAFRGDEPEHIDTFEYPVHTTLMLIGELDGVLYTTIRDGSKESYIHEFAKKSRPLLAASFDGSQAYILGGGYDFTDRGFVDK